MHLLCLLVCPDLVMMSLPCFPDIVVQCVDEDEASKGTWFKITLRKVLSVDTRSERLPLNHVMLLLLLLTGPKEFTQSVVESDLVMISHSSTALSVEAVRSLC